MHANAQAKRSGVAPAQIVGEPEQARSHNHDQDAYGCVEADEKTNERGANSYWITSGGRETMFPTDNPTMMLPTCRATTLLGIASITAGPAACQTKETMLIRLLSIDTTY